MLIPAPGTAYMLSHYEIETELEVKALVLHGLWSFGGKFTSEGNHAF